MGQSSPSAYLSQQWVPDAAAPVCLGCRRSFTLFRRRHHCRCCGEVFCKRCWGHGLALPADYGYQEQSVPVCTACRDIFGGPLRLLRVPRRIVMTRRAKAAVTATVNNMTKGVSIVRMGGGGGQYNANTTTTTRMASDGHLGGADTTAGTGAEPPLSRANVEAAAFEVFFLKLAHWRPLDAHTHLQFSITLRTASGKSSSAFTTRNDAADPRVQLNRVRRGPSFGPPAESTTANGKDSRDRSPGGHYYIPPLSAEDSRRPQYPPHRSAGSLPPSTAASTTGAGGEQLDYAWGVPVDAFVQVSLDYHEESDYITIETLQEVFRVQVADVFRAGPQGALDALAYRNSADVRFKLSPSGRPVEDTGADDENESPCASYEPLAAAGFASLTSPPPPSTSSHNQYNNKSNNNNNGHRHAADPNDSFAALVRPLSSSSAPQTTTTASTTTSTTTTTTTTTAMNILQYSDGARSRLGDGSTTTNNQNNNSTANGHGGANGDATNGVPKKGIRFNPDLLVGGSRAEDDHDHAVTTTAVNSASGAGSQAPAGLYGSASPHHTITSHPLPGTRYVVNVEDTNSLFLELQQLMVACRSRHVAGTSTMFSRRQ